MGSIASQICGTIGVVLLVWVVLNVGVLRVLAMLLVVLIVHAAYAMFDGHGQGVPMA